MNRPLRRRRVIILRGGKAPAIKNTCARDTLDSPLSDEYIL